MRRRPGLLATSLTVILAIVAVQAAPRTRGRRDQPFHVSHYAAGEALAIDGLWESPTGDRVRIAKGRAWDVTKRSGTRLEFVMWKDIRHEAAGRYRATATGCYGFPAAGELVTLSVVAAERIVVRSESLGDTAYRAVKLDARERLAADYEEARRLAATPPAVEVGAPGIEIHRVATRPAMVVAPGSPFDLVVDYTVTRSPTPGATAPVLFTSTIRKDNQVLLEVDPVLVDAQVGEPSSRTVHLTAGATPGEHSITVDFKLGGATASAETGLLIGDLDALYDKLTGSWKIVGRESPVTAHLRRTAHGLDITLVRPGGWRLTSSKTDVTPDRVVWKGTDRSDEMDCWIEWETTLHFGATLDELRGAAKIVDGGWCFKAAVLQEEEWRRIGE